MAHLSGWPVWPNISTLEDLMAATRDAAVDTIRKPGLKYAQ